MKKIIIPILILFIITGCNPCKRLAKKCPPIVHDSISYVETIKLDTITVVSEADTIMLMMRVDCPDFEVTEDNPDVKTRIVIRDSILTVETICKEDSLEMVIAQKDTELNQWKETVVNVPFPIPPGKVLVKERRLKVLKTCFWILLIGIIVAIVIVYVKYKTAIIKAAGKVKSKFLD